MGLFPYGPNSIDLSVSADVMKWKISLTNKIDTVWRKSYFLFGKETAKFIKDFRTSILYGTLYGHSLGGTFHAAEVKANDFLNNLLDGIDTLPKGFPELSISLYSQEKIWQ